MFKGTWQAIMEILSYFVLILVHLTWVSSSKFTNSKCDLRYYQHYEQKGCFPILGADGCPARYQCDPISEKDRKVCSHKGSLYKVGDAIKTTGPCDDCHCTDGWKTSDAFIECAQVDCPDWETQNKSCYMGYKPRDCCPTEMCPSEKKQKSCQYNGQSYKLGEHITVEDPCRSCLCTKKWDGPDGPGCSNVDCLIGLYVKNIRDGCIPIYSEKLCCPLEMYCGEICGATPIESPGRKTENLCHYQGRYYDIGSTVDLKEDKYNCNSCECIVPPDFTCIKKACPPMPKENCKTVYGHCCPNYECP